MSLYLRAKSILQLILPRKLLFRYELFFRYFSYLGRAGNTYRCNVCNSGLRSFVHSRQERICPRCGSIERVRRIWHLLKNDFLEDGMRVLDFSPSRSLYRTLRKEDINYTGSDLSGDFVADVAWDITAIPEADKSFDLIICYHILEHVSEDNKAMAELFRTLKPGGICLVQTPFKEGEIYENNSITDPEERARHFGQADHVRLYSAGGLKERLSVAGFYVEIREFPEKKEEQELGMKAGEKILVCRKTGNYCG